MEKNLLFEKTAIKSNFKVVTSLVILLLHFALLVYRLLTLADHGFVWLLAFLCESWFAFERVLSLATTWTPVSHETYPQNLLQRDSSLLPGVDMFVTTADPTVEQPILTMNTVLSLMAVDYPADKLACYFSDDGCSPLILYSLIETAEFARLWVPFCKKFNVQLRAPFRFFSSETPVDCESPEFFHERKHMKDKYDMLVQKIEEAANGFIQIDNVGEFLPFANTHKNDHPSIIKVIWENKERDEESLPHLIYVCREKRPKYHHHYKAGAMNVLTRVSGLMTNNPFMLNVDCDMFANNPAIVLQAMCSFLGLKPEDCAFVQFPQDFYNIPKDDPFGNQMNISFEIIGRGMNGIQGPPYVGTGCFHRRKLIYGFSSDTQEKCDDLEAMKKMLGSSLEYLGSVAQILSQSEDHNNVKNSGPQLDLDSALQASIDVARFDYEKGSSWGKQVGWGYESVVEDLLTGIKIHATGWKSVMLMPAQPGFLGTTPTTIPASLVQRKRWTAGLLQVLFGPFSPVVVYFTGKLQFRQCLAYTSLLIWTVHAIPGLCYSTLSAYCIITDSRFLPNANEPAMAMFATLFTIDKVLGLMFFLRCGQSARAWWNSTRMAKINLSTSYTFGILSCIVKALGISDIPFDLTPKQLSYHQEDSKHEEEDHGDSDVRFTFDESPMFVTGTTFVFLHLAALATGLFGRKNVFELGEFMCSVWVVLCFWPFVRGLFGKGRYGIPSLTVLVSACFAMILVKLFG